MKYLNRLKEVASNEDSYKDTLDEIAKLSKSLEKSEKEILKSNTPGSNKKALDTATELVELYRKASSLARELGKEAAMHTHMNNSLKLSTKMKRFARVALRPSH